MSEGDVVLTALAQADVGLQKHARLVITDSGGVQVDLADLSRASALLRFKVAADGVLLYECETGLFDRFRLEAISNWCDMEPVLTRAYDAELARGSKPKG